MQAARPLRAAQPAGVAGSAAAAGAQTAAAAGAATAAAGDAVPACRICWQEADDEPGGPLLAPCRCSGSSRHVHTRCLAAWMQSVAARKGVHRARYCDVCRAPYHLPRELRLREAPQQYLRRQGAALLASPAGTAASYYAAGSLVFSAAWALHGAWCSLMTLRSVVVAAQRQPLRALRPLLPDVALSMASEAFLSGQWRAPFHSAARFLQGLLLHTAACWAEGRAAAMLPPPLLPLALAACTLGKLVGDAMQYAHMGLLLLFGGLGRGFARGAVLAAMAPTRLVASACGALRQAGAAAAGLLLPGVGKRRRQRRQQGHGGRRQQQQQRRAPA